MVVVVGRGDGEWRIREWMNMNEEMVVVKMVDQVTGVEERSRMWREKEELQKEEEQEEEKEGEGKEEEEEEKEEKENEEGRCSCQDFHQLESHPVYSPQHSPPPSPSPSPPPPPSPVLPPPVPGR